MTEPPSTEISDNFTIVPPSGAVKDLEKGQTGLTISCKKARVVWHNMQLYVSIVLSVQERRDARWPVVKKSAS
jgi:hypothetical protein